MGEEVALALRVSVDLPDTLAALDPHYLRGALVAVLYHTGTLSERQACEALGMTRRAFEELLPRFGFSIFVDNQEGHRKVQLPVSEAESGLAPGSSTLKEAVSAADLADDHRTR